MKKLLKKAVRPLWKRKLTIIITSAVIVFAIAVFSYLTNPFTRFSIVDKDAVVVKKINNEFTVEVKDKVHVRSGPFFTKLAEIKSGWHILVNSFDPRIRFRSSNIKEITYYIHYSRFSEHVAFLISGEHFSVLYPRSLGIFYDTLIDPRTALDYPDWHNRQAMYLKTLALVLSIYDKSTKLSTTIVPVAPDSVVLVNIYAQPSDTLYSILYALRSLQTSEDLQSYYNFSGSNSFKLETKQAAQTLQKNYNSTLKRYIKDYKNLVYDDQIGLVKRNILLSSTKDSVKRSSSFYDNVIMWKTFTLAQQLGLMEKDEVFLSNLKKNIINSFWLEKDGYFLDELGEEAVKNKWYSSDWIIAYETGFLDADDPTDREILRRVVQYITTQKIDEPFGLRYQLDIRPKQLYRPVRIFAEDYSSTAIWSHWGMVYTKLLIRLGQTTGDKYYLEKAKHQLTAYTENIEEYGGYPELYKTDGNIYRTRFYRGVRSTGWIVNYEQAQTMYNWTEKNWSKFKSS